MTLVSLLQSVPCVYYRATIGNGGDRRTTRLGLHGGARDRVSRPRRSQAACGSSRAGRASMRRSASTSETGMPGDEPPGLDIRREGSTRLAEIDRLAGDRRSCSRSTSPTRPSQRPAAARSARTAGRYRESRLEPGDPVTIVGRALPFADLADPPAPTSATAPDRARRRPGGRRGPRRGAGRRAPWPTTRRRPGATPRSRASGSGGRSRRRRIDPAREPAAARSRPTRPRRAERTLRASRPRRWSWRRRPRCRCSSPTACPGASSSAARTGSCVGLLGAMLAIGSAMVFAVDAQRRVRLVTPPDVAAVFAVGLLVGDRRLHRADQATTRSSPSASGSTRRGRTSTSSSSSATTSSPTSSPRSAA